MVDRIGEWLYASRPTWGRELAIANSFDVDVSGGLSIDPLRLAGIPTSFNLTVDDLPKIEIGVDPLHVAVDDLPKIEIGVDPLHVAVDSLPKIQIGVDPLEFRLTEFPSIRAHLPADFHVGVSLLGHELIGVRLCGEAQAITEPYVPNPCERGDPDAMAPA